MLLVSLIGEQPLPNYLPIQQLKPPQVLLICTEKTSTQAERLKNVLMVHPSPPKVEIINVHPYLLQEIYEKIHKRVQEEENVLFNVTGGTKMMSAAAMLLAANMRKKCLYYQSENNLSRLYHYTIENGIPQLEKYEDLEDDYFSVDDYLRLYLGKYRLEGYHKEKNGKLSDGGLFEQAVCETLKKEGFEVLAGIRPEGEGNQLEIDLIFRLKNQIGIAEIKLGDKENESIKKGIDQLSTASQREYLGTYAHRFLITARKVTNANKKIAYRHGVKLIQLTDYSSLNPNRGGTQWKKILIETVKEKMLSNKAENSLQQKG